MQLSEMVLMQTARMGQCHKPCCKCMGDMSVDLCRMSLQLAMGLGRPKAQAKVDRQQGCRT